MDNIHKIVSTDNIRLPPLYSNTAINYRNVMPYGYTMAKELNELEYTVYVHKDNYDEFINKTWPHIVSIIVAEYKGIYDLMPNMIEVDGITAAHASIKIRDIAIVLHNKLYIDICNVDIVDDYILEMNIIKVHS